MEIRELIRMAAEAKKMAYAPYSGFYVGAALLAEDGSIYTGCNIENASYGATVCAERTAVFKAVSEGHIKIKMICVVGNETGSLTYPCGICRQVIAEFADGDTKIIIAQNEEKYVVKSIAELLPLAFTKGNL